eukprot:CAMPEP_0205819902 /NCGR_PEP_ID=MMETSP0206-20130828/2404_1 /ASSEMBLY_ACC=CAM_ASM_000279 /TAXON_ID=36767 /ORGANISM="Euplotes focardii, Strain TN1" /LENGTH=604 /DNA_ID=CAMNT_0053113993 /DNA_START=26 /DNA_END=1840 /DNA_ORIENTATION=+
MLWKLFAAVTLLAGASGERVAKTVLQFSRKIDTCDSDRDQVVEPGTHRVIYAYNDDAPADNDPNAIGRHSELHRGTRSLNLLQGGPSELPPMEDDARSFLARASVPLEIPFANQSRTQYYCVPMRVPEFRGGDLGEHIIRAEPSILAENLDVLHHIIVYSCPDELTDEDLAWHGTCLERIPDNLNKCRENWFHVWAVGGNIWTYPSNVGMPIGRADSPNFFLMEIHYDNPTNRDVVDNSGILFWSTAQLREEDAGILQVGSITDPRWTIPAGHTDYNWPAWCPTECMEKLLPEGGINIIGGMLHAHLAGRQLHLYHDRDGVELAPLMTDGMYDFDFQDILPMNATLMPNDQLRLHCHYDTTDRDAETPFGLASDQEMCMVFLTYWPAQPHQTCNSGNLSAASGTDEGPLVLCGPDALLIGPDDFEALPTPEPCEYEAPDANRTTPEWINEFDQSKYERTEVLDRDGKFILHWTVEEDEIHFAAEVETTGWLGFGFGSAGGMAGADIMLGWADRDNHKVYLHDRMADAMARPPLDPFQDLYDIKGGEVMFGENNQVNAGLIIGVVITVVVLVTGVAFAWVRMRNAKLGRSEHAPLVSSGGTLEKI